MKGRLGWGTRINKNVFAALFGAQAVVCKDQLMSERIHRDPNHVHTLTQRALLDFERSSFTR